MNVAIQPLQILLISVAGWMGRRQQEVIEYLVEETLLSRGDACREVMRECTVARFSAACTTSTHALLDG